MKQLKVWPHMTLVALVCALLGGGAAALWVRHQRTNEVKTLPSAARVERVDGDVGVSHNAAGANGGAADNQQWLQATTNTPVSVGDRIYARDNSRASVAFTGRNFARLNPRSSLDVMYLAPDRTQLALRDGSAMFDVGALSLPYPVLILLAAYALAWLVLNYTRFGRHTYALGDSEEAARLMGLNVGRVTVGVYTLSGALAGLAGVLLTSRLGTGQPVAANG